MLEKPNLKIRQEGNRYLAENSVLFNRLVELVESNRFGFCRRLRGKDMASMRSWIENILPLLKDRRYTLATKCHWIIAGLEDFPKCPVCGKDLSIDAGAENCANVSPFRGYRTYCSRLCMVRDPETYRKGKKTRLERHGDENWTNREKAAETSNERYGDAHFSNPEKRMRTNVARHGTPFWTNPEKASRTKRSFSPSRNAEISEKRRRTCIAKTGFESPSQDPKNKTRTPEKIRKTCTERYGVAWPTMRPEIQEKTK